MASEQQDVESKHEQFVSAPPPPPPVAPVVIANPGPLGLSGFALTTFVLSLHNAGAVTRRYVGVPRNTFGATAFSSYGGFWLSFGMIFIPGSGILDSYKGDTVTLNQSLGFYLLGWTIFTGVMLIASHRSSVGLVSLFFMLFITFILLTAGKFNNSITTQIAGGAFGVVTAFIAWYNALAGLLTKDSSYFQLPIGRLS
ncbi:hypothetical protein [Absidia glauca]|uniref:Uncharacterized protein n=1 Tax=Absidia glauca TaxID=4829 RepID=A0A163KJC8_ABSGL|nr:hypothetical protein [Absidia glauca]